MPGLRSARAPANLRPDIAVLAALLWVDLGSSPED